MSYLSQYGVADYRREKVLKFMVVSLVICSIVGGSLFLLFKNYLEERQVKRFLSHLQSENYAVAYRLWGCSVSMPCDHYSYEDFLEDWGPNSPIGKIENFRLGRSNKLENGVIVEIEINGQSEPELWVEENTGAIGFSPYRFRKTLSFSAS